MTLFDCIKGHNLRNRVRQSVFRPGTSFFEQISILVHIKFIVPWRRTFRSNFKKCFFCNRFMRAWRMVIQRVHNPKKTENFYSIPYLGGFLNGADKLVAQVNKRMIFSAGYDSQSAVKASVRKLTIILIQHQVQFM